MLVDRNSLKRSEFLSLHLNKLPPDTLQDKLVLNTKALEELPNIAQSLDVIRQKKEYALKIEVIGKELSKMDGVHDVDMMRSWTKKLSVLQAQVD